MATALAANDEHDEALEDQTTSDKKLREVFDRAMKRFDIAVLPQLEQRTLSLKARRFVSIPGAMWEGDFGDAFDDAIKMEINLTSEGLDKIRRDYNENRIVPDFKPANGKGDDDSAETLDGMYRADFYFFKSQQALDNAFDEASAGGFGAYRLTNEWANPYDKDSDEQRINPGMIIVDADQRVFFDPDSKLYDKSDAKYGFVITAKQRQTYEDEYEGYLADFVPPIADPVYDWFTPDTVKVAEYYEVEDSTEKLLIMTNKVSGEEQRYWDSEIDADEVDEMKKLGWTVKTRQLKRRRVHKYVISGAEVLRDQGKIAGDRIPIVPVYGKRSFVDGVERFKGYVQDRMDRNRLYNMAVSKIAETSAQSPRSIPIFAVDQMDANLAEMWSRQVVDRHAYALVKPLMDANGTVISAGPIGTVPPAQIDSATAAVLQIARSDLTDDQQDGADEVKANTSADAMDIAATRIDAKSGIYLDNMRQSVQCGGEIYLSMCADVNFEPDREVETMTEDGNDGTATLVQPYTNDRGVHGYKNDFTRGHYKVVVSVTEATATRRDKTVRSALNTAKIAEGLDPELALAALITAIENQDGEGMGSLQKFARMKGLKMGLDEPTEEEAAEIAKAAEAQQGQPDPQAEFIAAKTKEAEASALDKTASAGLKTAQASVVGGPEAAPEAPSGLEHAHKVADIGKKVAETQKIQTEIEHMPEKLRIEAANAGTNRLKVTLDRFKQFATGLGGRSSG